MRVKLTPAFHIFHENRPTTERNKSHFKERFEWQEQPRVWVPSTAGSHLSPLEEKMNAHEQELEGSQWDTLVGLLQYVT